METSEINNLNLTANKTINNVATSDELKVSSTNEYNHETNFAKSKRVSKVVTTIITLSATALLSGSFLINTFLGSDPVINNFATAFTVADNILSYKFDLTIESTSLTMKLDGGKLTFADVVFTKSGAYEGNYTLEYDTDYTVSFMTTNGFDYKRSLSQYTYTFHSPVQSEE